MSWENAVHAKIGFTGISIGYVNTHVFFIPMIIEKERLVDLKEECGMNVDECGNRISRSMKKKKNKKTKRPNGAEHTGQGNIEPMR